MKCKHQFVRISDLRRTFDGNQRGEYGASAGCVECGEVREVFENGTLRVIVEGSPLVRDD